MFNWIKKVIKGEFEYDTEKLAERYENSQFWFGMSEHLCSSESWIANIAYVFYGDTECPCCTFWRGLLIGVTTGLVFGIIVW